MIFTRFSKCHGEVVLGLKDRRNGRLAFGTNDIDVEDAVDCSDLRLHLNNGGCLRVGKVEGGGVVGPEGGGDHAWVSAPPAAPSSFFTFALSLSVLPLAPFRGSFASALVAALALALARGLLRRHFVLGVVCVPFRHY